MPTKKAAATQALLAKKVEKTWGKVIYLGSVRLLSNVCKVRKSVNFRHIACSSRWSPFKRDLDAIQKWV